MLSEVNHPESLGNRSTSAKGRCPQFTRCTKVFRHLTDGVSAWAANPARRSLLFAPHNGVSPRPATHTHGDPMDSAPADHSSATPQVPELCCKGRRVVCDEAPACAQECIWHACLVLGRLILLRVSQSYEALERKRPRLIGGASSFSLTSG